MFKKIDLMETCTTFSQFSCLVVSDSLQPHGLQHARLPCPSPTQIHVHPVSDAIQPSHPLFPPSSAFNLFQHQGLFQWVMWKGLCVRLECFSIMTMELWVSMMFSEVPSYIVPFLRPSPLWYTCLKPYKLSISQTIYWSFVSGDIAALHFMWGQRIPDCVQAHWYLM